MRWVGVTLALAMLTGTGAGCGSRIIAGSELDAMEATIGDGSLSQRGQLDARDAGVDPDAARPDATRDAGPPDVKPPVDAPVAQCAATARRCDGKTPQYCDAAGVWQNLGAPCPFLCAAGICSGACVPGTFQCAGTTRRICGADGQWADYLACPFACIGADCAGTCFPGRTQCVAGELQTCSAMGAWQTTGLAARELLTNGSFDDGETGWTNDGIPIVYAATGSGGNRPDVVAQSAPNVAWFGGINRVDDELAQAITIPANVSAVTLSFYYAIISAEITSAENDTLEVSVTTHGGDVVPLAQLSDNNEVDDWTRFQVAVPVALAGQTVTLRIHVTTSAILVTSFYVDTVSVQAIACP